MSNGVQKPGLRQQQRSLSDRMAGLEQAVAKMLFGVNQRFQGLDQRVTATEELIQALVELNGIGDVERIVNEKRIENAKAQAAQEKASLEEAVADGYVSSETKVGEKSVIVGQYTDKDGKIVEPGRAQLVIPGVQPQFREKLLGQEKGFVLDLPDGGKFTLQEIYSVDEAKAKAVQEAKQKAAADAAKKAAEEAAAKAKETAETDEKTDTEETGSTLPATQDGQ